METRYTGILVILVVIVVAGAAIISGNQRDAIVAEHLYHTFFDIPEEDQNSFSIALLSNPRERITFRNRNGRWETFGAQHSFLVDPAKVDEIIQLLQTPVQGKLIARLPSSHQAHGVGTSDGILVNFGYDEMIGFSDSQVIVGHVSETGQATYVRKGTAHAFGNSESLNYVYEIPIAIRHLFAGELDPHAWRSPFIIDLNLDEIESLKVVDGEGEVLLTRRGEQSWDITIDGATEPADTTLVKSLITGLVSIRSIRFADDLDEETVSQAGIDSPSTLVEITRKSGNVKTVKRLKFGAETEEGSGQFYVQNEEYPYIQVVSRFHLDTVLRQNLKRLRDLAKPADPAPTS